MCFPFFAWYLTLPHVTQATQIDRLIGSVANGLNSSSRFFPGSHLVLDRQRINGTSFVFFPVTQLA